jgi:hypothetical protein
MSPGRVLIHAHTSLGSSYLRAHVLHYPPPITSLVGYGRFLAGMPDDDLLQRPIVASEKEEVDKFLPPVVARFQAFKKKVPSRTFAGKRPRGKFVCVQDQILCSVSAFGSGECSIQ